MPVPSIFYKIPDQFMFRNRSTPNTASFIYREIHNQPDVRSYVYGKVKELELELYYLTKEQYLKRCPDGTELHVVHDMFPIDLIIKDVEKDVEKIVELEQKTIQEPQKQENKENNSVIISQKMKNNKTRTYKITYKMPKKQAVVYKQVIINKPCCI